MNSHCLTKDDYSYLCRLLQCIDIRNWRTLEKLLRANPEKFASVSKAVSRSSKLNGMTILHACMRFDPPPRIVQLIIQLSPISPSCADCLNRTPLHIGAAVRANPKSLAILIDACRHACTVQDVDGKTPLHFASDVTCALFVGDEGVVREPPSMAVIQCLVLASPESVPLEDEDETNALEYAILSNADVNVVKFLMHATQMQLRRQELYRIRIENEHDTN